jgi:hypothetical protein
VSAEVPAARPAAPTARQSLYLYGTAIVLTIIAALGSAFTSLGLLAIVGGAAFALLLLFMWARPTSILWLVIIGFALQPDLKFFISSYFGPAKDIIAIAAIIVTAIYVGGRRRRRQLSCDPWIVSGMLAVIALYLIDVGGSHDGVWQSAVRPVIEAFGLFLCGYVFLRTDDAWRVCVRAMLAMGLLEAVTGILDQLVGGAFLANTLGFPYNEVVIQVGPVLRSFGTQLDPFNYAAMTALTIPFAFFTMGEHRRRQATAIGLLAIGVVCAFIRTSAGIGLGLILLGLVRAGRAATAGFVLAATVLVLVAYLVNAQSAGPGPSTAATLNGRTTEWARVFHPEVLLAGAGVGQFGSGADRQLQGAIISVQKQGQQSQDQPSTTAAATSIDSSYLALISDVGLPGLLLVLAVFARIVAIGLAAIRIDSTAGSVLLGMVLVVAIDGVTRSSLTQFPFGPIALLAIGVAVAACERVLAENRRRAAAPSELFIGYGSGASRP